MEKLFWENPYLKECNARITKIDGNKLQLDKTIFYAFSGGQASDKGTIGGVNVVNAYHGDFEDEENPDKNNDIITYVLEEAPHFKVGDTVKVEIDWDYRYKLMRLHSAAHVVYYFLKEKGIENNFGSNVSIDKARLDYEMNESIKPVLNEIEPEINKFLQEDHEVTLKSDDKDKKIRHWICCDWDMHCAGTHVKNLKEIGKIRLKRKNLGTGKERVEITLAD